MLCGVGGELKRCSSVECVHGATQTKFLQGLGLPEVVDALEVVGEQVVKVVLRRGGQETKRRGRVLRGGGMWGRRRAGVCWLRRVGGWSRGGSW